MKHYKSVEIFSIFRESSIPAKTQGPLLKTFWPRFWFPPHYNPGAAWKNCVAENVENHWLGTLRKAEFGWVLGTTYKDMRQ